jgi:arylsulfatase A-like enzyme
VHTAAFLYAPGLQPRRVKDATVFTDIAPTVLNLLGIKSGYSTLHGRNLLPLLAGGKLEPTPFVIESFTVDVAKQYMLAVVDWPYKLVYTEEGQRVQLYDLSRDPTELSEFPILGNDRIGSMESFLFRYLETSARRGRVLPGRHQ